MREGISCLFFALAHYPGLGELASHSDRSRATAPSLERLGLWLTSPTYLVRRH